MPITSLPLLSLQLAGRLTPMASGTLWIDTADDRPPSWGIDTVLERATSLPSDGDLPVRAKARTHILSGQASVVGTATVSDGYQALTLRGHGRLRGAEDIIARMGEPPPGGPDGGSQR